MVKLNLTTDTFDNISQNGHALTISTPLASYTLPARMLDLQKAAAEMGVSAKDLQISVIIEKTDSAVTNSLQKAAGNLHMESVAEPANFALEVKAGSQVKQIESFGNVLVERELPLKRTVDVSHVVGVVFDPHTNTFSPVPTVIRTTKDGQVAVLKRNGNSIYSVMTTSKTFQDTQGHWAKGTIETLASKMITSGVTEQEFQPQSNLTRAQLAAFVVRALGLQSNSATASFTDVKSTDWYAGYISAATLAGIINGYPDQTFQPNTLVTRQEAAVILIRAMKFAGHTLTLAESEQEALFEKYADGIDVPAWAKNDVASAIQAGVLTGYADQSLQPKGHATRAETAVLILRMMRAAKSYELIS